ncbi:ThiF family adenylyltransferase [Agreia sp. COWG]|uniref:ThiF family adenylyltransferase n=1 Tax=Agreia sp. COWG TaxID=2773266 RepID=UPI001925842E|nr:ThiF family adenylyltransferase [Agreia sp. COWG]CAD5995295.1 Sulfur carrier protein CysO adenylyltransferase / Sulfur carrier protein CysO sulfurtransferase [Agreia sp. COWG]
MPHSPLVSPGAALTPAELSRYARQLSLAQIGIDGQRRLKASRVLVLGAGGLGSPVLTSLVAAGVGTVGVVDSDTVEPSNLQRQTLFATRDVGRGKAEAAADALAELNPLVAVVPLSVRLTSANVLALVADYDVIVDGTDNFETRYLAHDAAQLLGKPYVWGSVLRFDGQATVFWAAPPESAGVGVTLRDLFAEEPPAQEGETCASAGVLGAVCASIGSVMATETIKLLLGFGELLLGRLLVHDGLDATWREIRFGPAPAGSTPRPRSESAPASIAPPGPLETKADTMTEPTASDPTPDQGATALPDAGAERISPAQLKALLDARERGDESFVLVDVREPWEREIVAIDGSELIPMSQLLSDEAREKMPVDERVILYCHHDGRSGQARDYMAQNGWSNISDLGGGVDSWVADVEPDKARY